MSIYEHLNAKEKLLRDAANQYRETERKSVALLQKAAQYTLNGLFPFLATSKGTGTSSPASTGYPVMMGWQDLLKNAVQTATAIFSEMTLDQRLAHVKEDARISGLFQQLNSGSWDEQVRAREELENIAAAFDKIARIQHEYAVYKAYGNKNYMALAHQEAQQQRNILNGLGVSELWYGPEVNLSTYYKGSPLDACRYNPLKSDYSPMPREDELRMAIAIGWVNPLQREWAKCIYAQTEAALLKRASLSEADRLLQDAIDFYNEKRKGNEDDFHTYNLSVKMGIGVEHDPNEIGDPAYWQQQNLTDERKKELAYIILNAGTDEAIAGSFASLYTNYAEHQAEMNGGYGDGVGFPVFGQRRSPLEMPGMQKFTEPQEQKRPLTPSKQGELDRPKVQGVVSVNGGAGKGVVPPKTVISPEMEAKILEGQRKAPKNELIGGHSPSINNANDNFAVEVLSTNADGTKNVVFTKQFPDSNISKLKKSTLFPDSWSDDQILKSITDVGNTPAISTRMRDGATWHRATINGVEIDVIKVGDDVTSGYPTGTINASRPSGF